MSARTFELAIAHAIETADRFASNKADWDSAFLFSLKGWLEGSGITALSDAQLIKRTLLPRDYEAQRSLAATGSAA